MKKMDVRAELKKEYKIWNLLFCKGGNDPFWLDGVSLNLVRNHIIACKKSLEQEGGEMPEEYGWPLPPELPPDYMVRKKEIWYRGLESYQKYRADDNYRYLKEVSESLSKKVRKESSIESVLGYEKAVRKALEEEDYVTLRRHEHPENFLEAFARCRKKIGELLAQERADAIDQEILERDKEKEVGQANLHQTGRGGTGRQRT